MAFFLHREFVRGPLASGVAFANGNADVAGAGADPVSENYWRGRSAERTKEEAGVAEVGDEGLIEFRRLRGANQ